MRVGVISNKNNKFVILLATWNGEQFLGEQLDSLELQTAKQIDVWVSDDSSTDQTMTILTARSKKWSKGRFEIIKRKRATNFNQDTPASGSNENFRSLIINKKIKADFYAFCDQDDIWDPDKLERAQQWLSSQEQNVPCLYCTRTRIMDEEGMDKGLSPHFKKDPSFKNAIIQNIAAGNTIVVNQAAMSLIQKTAINSDFVSHDWWCYIIVTAFGGKVHYSEEPSLSYRQHSNNLVGENASWKARMTRLKLVLNGRFKRWNDRNRIALSVIEDQLDTNAKNTLLHFDKIRSRKGLNAAVQLASSGIKRQSFGGQLSLYFACIIGKI